MCANPQVENGHTDIANELMEEFAKTRIPGEARQVLDFILRKTYGWHKKEDALSLSQFVGGTGLSKVHICQAIRTLKKMNLITQNSNVTEFGNTTFTEKGKAIGQVYGFNKNFDLWQPLPKKVTLPKKVKGFTEKGNKPLPNSDTTKENYTKETITKEKESTLSTLSDPIGITPPLTTKISKKSIPPNPDVKIFIDWYSDKFLHVFGEKPVIEGAKDGAIIKRLLGVYGLEKLTGLGEAFFGSDDEFICKTGYTIGVFSKVLNKLITNKNTQNIPKEWRGLKEYIAERDNINSSITEEIKKDGERNL